ncbi:MFS transporter [Jeotgalibaca sp. A122]|uniref:MFS transporter n=1 Tax=Jeotgalibaca sp. A122 TaxID=3457322 RepID=UPI003FD5E3BD
MDRDQFSQWKRNIILFLSSQTVSLIGSSIVQYAITWHLTLTTQSGFVMTLAVIFGFLPTFFISPFAGVWADRYNRKNLIALSDAFIALSTLFLVFLFASGYDSIWVLLVASSVRAFGSGIQMPAVSAIIPQIVSKDKLMRVNGLNGTIQAMVTLISPMISALLLNYFSLAQIFMIDVITAVLAIIIVVFFLRVATPEKEPIGMESRYLDEMKAGFIYIRDHVFIRNLFIYYAFIFIMFVPPAFLSPLQVTRTFGNDVWRLSALEVTFSSGMIVGGAIIAAWSGFKNRMHTIIGSVIVMAVCTLGMGVIPDFWIYMTMMGIIGLVVPMLNAPSMVLMQEKVEDAFLGRVFGVQTMISTITMPLGMLVFGPLADRVPISWLMLFSGCAMLGGSLYALRNSVLIAEGIKEE